MTAPVTSTLIAPAFPFTGTFGLATDTITTADMAHARVTWHRLAPTNAKAILDAPPLPDTAPDGSDDRTKRLRQALAIGFLFGVRWRRYVYDPATGRYLLASGTVVPPTYPRLALDAVLDAQGQAMRALSLQLQQRTITLDAWLVGMRQAVIDAQLMGAALARGGWVQLTEADLRAVVTRIGQQLGYLDGFARDLRAGLPLDGRFVARAASYAQAGRPTYEAVRGEAMRAIGFTEERNILHAAEHCGVCLEQTARGWQAIGLLVPIGERTCLTHCKCTLDYRAAA